MKQLILLIGISFLLFSFNSKDIILKDLNGKVKYSANNGKDWKEIEHRNVTIQYPNYTKESSDYGISWDLSYNNGKKKNKINIILSSNKINLEKYGLKEYNYFKLYDQSGLLIDNGNIISNTVLININKPNIYFLKIYNKNNINILKILYINK